MIPIFSTKIIMAPDKEVEPTGLKCPKCQGDLVTTVLAKYLTFFGHPIIRQFYLGESYYCNMCDLSYRKENRDQLLGGGIELEKKLENLYITALIAGMTYMAKIDGDICDEERGELERVAQNYPEYKDKIRETIDVVAYTAGSDHVMEILRKTKDAMTAHRIIKIVEDIAKVQLADGVIHEDERRLMTASLAICGVPEAFLDAILIKLTGKQEGLFNITF